MIPENFDEDSNKLKAVINREVDSPVKNNKWTLVKRPPMIKKVTDVKLIYIKGRVKGLSTN